MTKTVLTRMTVLLLACAGCTDSTTDARDASHAASPDAGRHVNVRTVTIDLPPIATREMSQGADGEPVYGEIEQLDDADVCIVQRRDAFDVFEKFDPIDPPICVKSTPVRGPTAGGGGPVVRISGAPAKSDLVITVEHEGLRPVAMTERTGDYDVGVSLGNGFSTVLLKPGAADPWLEPPPPLAQDHGVVDILTGVIWTGPAHAQPEVIAGEDVFFGRQDRTAFAANVRVIIEPLDGDAIETTTLSRPRFVSLPAGSARFKFASDNERVSCGALGTTFGLPAAGNDTLELPVLAGHDHFVGLLCSCDSEPTEELLDLDTCTVAPGDAGDADGG